MRYKPRIFSSVLALTAVSVVLPAGAAIISDGDVTPSGIGPGDTTTSGVTVGGDFASTGTGQITIDGGSELTTSSPSPFGNIAPLAGSTGSVTVTGSDGGTPSTWRLEGQDAAGEGAFLTIGRGGSGSLAITNGGRVEIDGLGGDFIRGDVSSPFPAGFQLGRDSLGSGVVNISGPGSELAVTSELAFGRIGRDGSGTMNITNDGLLSFSGVNSDLNVASDGSSPTPGTGILNINSGGRVQGPVFMDVGGRPGATGTVNLSGAGSSITLLGACTPDCPSGFSAPNQGAFLSVGVNEGSGVVTVNDGAKITIDSTVAPNAAEFAGFNLGANEFVGSRGDGTLNVEGMGSQVLVRGARSFFSVGRLEDGTGTLNIRNGGSVVMDNVDGNASGFVADRPGATGTVTVTGAGSVLDAGNYLGIGVDQAGAAAGNGVIQLASGGTVKADELQLGKGASLVGNGTVTSSTSAVGQTRLNDGGTISPGLSTGELVFDGDLIMEAGTMLLEANSPADFDKISIAGDLILRGGVIDVLLGFVPDVDFVLDPFSITGDIQILDTFGGVSGVPGTSLRIGERVFSAPAAVPLPGTLLLVVMGLIAVRVATLASPGLRR